MFWCRGVFDKSELKKEIVTCNPINVSNCMRQQEFQGLGMPVYVWSSILFLEAMHQAVWFLGLKMSHLCLHIAVKPDDRPERLEKFYFKTIHSSLSANIWCKYIVETSIGFVLNEVRIRSIFKVILGLREGSLHLPFPKSDPHRQRN